ncbi:hypothetical protein [Streptomyces sp. NPDC005907]|uniref:hypothetical protein n=1 Tax=Streptomyces sp. NPDC005907 TaxID=3154571 RepID=UPI003401229A
MKSEDTPFEGGPLDGRILPVLLGMTGHPPKVYRVPVPDAAGGPPTVLVYRRVQRPPSGRFALHPGWKYAYDPAGGKGRGLKWPWSRPDPAPDRGTGKGTEHGATPTGKPDDADE